MLDIVRPDSAQILSTYNYDFYKGEALITKNNFGKGCAYYIGTSSDEEFYDALIEKITSEKSITGVYKETKGLEVTVRETDEYKFIFALCRNEDGINFVCPYDGTDILTDKSYSKEEIIKMTNKDVVIFRVKK